MSSSPSSDPTPSEISRETSPSPSDPQSSSSSSSSSSTPSSTLPPPNHEARLPLPPPITVQNAATTDVLPPPKLETTISRPTTTTKKPRKRGLTEMPSLSSESSTDSRRSLRSVSVKQSGESEEKITKEQDEEKKLGSSGAAPFSSRLARSSVSYRKSQMPSTPATAGSSLGRKRQLIIEEIIATEKTYVNSLRTLIGLWVLPLKCLIGDAQNEIISEMDLRLLFSNIELLLGVNEQLFSDLNERYHTWEAESALPQSKCIGDIFANIAPMMKLYTQYCNNYGIAQERLHHLSKENRKFVDFMKASREVQESALDVASFLIMPIQRIPRYILLLNDLLNHTPAHHPDYEGTKKAITKLEDVANHANRSIGDVANTEKILKIQDQLIGYENLLQPARKFVREGELTKIMSTRVRETWFILFSDVMIYGYRRIGNTIQYKGIINMGTTWIRDLEDTGTIKNLFQIVAEKKTYTVYSSSPEIKADWMEGINTVIEQNVQKRPELVKSRGPVRVRTRPSVFSNFTFSPEEFDPELKSIDSKEGSGEKWLTVDNSGVAKPTQNVFDTFSAPTQTDEHTSLLRSDPVLVQEDERCCSSCTIL